MDNLNNGQNQSLNQQPSAPQQSTVPQHGMAQPQMGGYTQQPMYNQQMGGYTQQPMYNQQMGGYTQQPMYNQQMGGYTQYGYQQPKMGPTLSDNVKKVQNEFKSKVSKMGLSTYCLVGIIAAMLLIFSPFMNFATLHVNEKYEDEWSEIELKIKASDGLNLFELSKLSNTLDDALDETKKLMGMKIDKDDILDVLDDVEDEADDVIEDETGIEVKESSIKEVVGLVHLVVDGKMPLMITPWLLIVSGLGLLVFTVINNKKGKMVCSIIPVGCIVWLMLSSSNFFSIMGIGAWAMLLGAIGGIVSSVKELPLYN